METGSTILFVVLVAVATFYAYIGKRYDESLENGDYDSALRFGYFLGDKAVARVNYFRYRNFANPLAACLFLKNLLEQTRDEALKKEISCSIEEIQKDKQKLYDYLCAEKNWATAYLIAVDSDLGEGLIQNALNNLSAEQVTILKKSTAWGNLRKEASPDEQRALEVI